MKIGGTSAALVLGSALEPFECHSEERRDEESAFPPVSGLPSPVLPTKQILHFVQDDSPAVRGKGTIFILLRASVSS